MYIALCYVPCMHRSMPRGIFAVILAVSVGAASITRAEDWSPLWSTGELSQARFSLAATAAGTKMFFAGGDVSDHASTKIVDIYDTATSTWSTAALSEARDSLVATSAGNKVFFAGGKSSLYSSFCSNKVDVYDIESGIWSTERLSQARMYLSATSVGNEVFFGGGDLYGTLSNVVDVYNTSTGSWSVKALSQARRALAATSSNGKVFFAGGSAKLSSGWTYTNVVDIYEPSTGNWSNAALSQGRVAPGAASIGNKIFFGGGAFSSGYSNVVDIYDVAANTWSTKIMSEARTAPATVSACGKIFFAGGGDGVSPDYASNAVDIYDSGTDTWSTARLSQPRAGVVAAAAGNKVLFAGGQTSPGVYTKAIDIYTFQNYSTIASSKDWRLVDHTTVAGLMELAAGRLNLGGYDLTLGSMSGGASIGLDSQSLAVGSDNTSTTYSGAISGSGSLFKTGTGTLTFTASNAYTGPTTINAGQLKVNVPGALLSPVTINSGGTLGGNGTVSSVTVKSGGHMAPGNSAGTLSLTGGLSLESGALLEFELASSAASDRIWMPTLTLNLGGQQFSDFSFAPLLGFGPGTYTLIDAGAIQGGLGTNRAGLINGLPATISVVGNDVVLNVVPEPSTVALLGGALMSLYALWRRRRVKQGRQQNAQMNEAAIHI